MSDERGGASVKIGAALAAIGLLTILLTQPGTALAWSINAGCSTDGVVSGQFDMPSSYPNDQAVYARLFDGASNIGQDGPFYDGSGSGTGGHIFHYTISAAGHSGDLVVKLFYNGAYHESAHTNPDCAAPTPTRTPTSTPTFTPTNTPTNTPTSTPTNTPTTPTNTPTDPTSTPVTPTNTPGTQASSTPTNTAIPTATGTQTLAQLRPSAPTPSSDVAGVRELPRTGSSGLLGDERWGTPLGAALTVIGMGLMLAKGLAPSRSRG